SSIHHFLPRPLVQQNWGLWQEEEVKSVPGAIHRLPSSHFETADLLAPLPLEPAPQCPHHLHEERENVSIPTTAASVFEPTQWWNPSVCSLPREDPSQDKCLLPLRQRPQR
ncbi:hypothetical protein NECAME_03303, partial [Necator americanus]